MNESQSCYVCDLCYKLLITDQELSEIQKTIAVCMNIDPSNEEDGKCPKGQPGMIDRDQMVKVYQKFGTLTQFRIMFYFSRLYQIQLGKLNLDEKQTYKMFIKLFDHKVSVKIFENLDKFKSKDEVELNFSKMFYFFSNDLNGLKQLLKNETIDFRIVANDDWDSPIAQCQAQCLSFFDTNTSTFRVKNIFNFFSNEIKHFKCQTYIGLTNDGSIYSDKLVLYNYRFLNCLYLTDMNYFSYHPLPDEWSELFLSEGTNFEDEDFHLDLESAVNDIIANLGFKDHKGKEDQDSLYDPYDTLVRMREKKQILSKIKSIAMIQDKDPWEKKVQMKKVKPNSAMIRDRFRIDVNAYTERKESLDRSNFSKSSYVKSSEESEENVHAVDDDIENMLRDANKRFEDLNK